MAPTHADRLTVAFQVVLSPGEKRALRRRRYRSITFDRLDFASADFRLSHFEGVTFCECDFRGADFRGAELKGCRFVRCDLAAVQLGRNRFVDTEFRHCRNLLANQRQRVLAMGGRWIGSLRD
jgi:uncharacterized protein YjbI with pentapeptide repeats